MLVKSSILAAFLGLAAVGCTKSNPVSCVDDYCQDPSLPFCDVDGALEGQPQTCIAVDCTPGSVAGCRGDNEIVCNDTGNNYDISHCDHGCDATEGCKAVSCVPNTTKCGQRVVETCSATGVLTTQACDVGCFEMPTPHCAYIEPKYLPNVCDAMATTGPRSVAIFETIDTSVDTTCNGGIVPQTNGPDICIVRYESFKIESTGGWRVTGARVLAIVTDGTLQVTGKLDVSSDLGGVVGPGTSPSRGGAGTENVSGGAGFATNGGNGGSTPGSGGPSYDPLTEPYFVGGRGGGVRTTYCGSGGSGGGAATLISCRQAVVIDGTVDASGGGGRGGRAGSMGMGNCPGAGGGAGGYVVLQGVDVRVSGQMFANGGGGGCGKPFNANGLDGANGAAATGAPVGCTPTTDEGSGGAGGAEGFAPANGGPGAGTGGSARTAGGGGGSVGYFQTYTPSTVIPTLTPAASSPRFQANRPVPVR